MPASNLSVGSSGPAGGGAAAGGAGSASNLVSGTVYFDTGLPAAGLTLRAYSRGFAGADALLGETKTDAQGAYSITYNPASRPVSLEIRAMDAQGKETALSKVKYKAAARETLHLIAPSTLQPLAPEFQRLARDLERFGGIAKLGQALENDARQDLTLINRETQWDARLVALAATAAQQTASTGLGADVLYGLYRVGMPTDTKRLALVPADVIRETLAKVNQSGIISLNEQQIAAATKTFQAFATKTQLALTAPGGVSTYGELLASALTDATQQAAFAGLYFSNPSAGASLWAEAAKLQIPAASLNALRLQGKLNHLAGGSLAVAQKLQQEIGSLDNLAQLAEKNYHQNGTWKTTITALAGAGGDAALDKLIPAQYTGATTADRLDAYSADLARKVRFSFPTQVTAQMIDNKELAIHAGSAPKVSAFLRAAAAKGYELGRTPLSSFSKRTGLPAMDAASTESLKTVHRLYQITPSNESLQAAMSLGFQSANEVASIPYDKFMSKYSGAFPSSKEAQWVYWKSQQVSSVTFNFFSMAKQLDTSPPIYALSASSDDRQNAKDAIVKQFPTMTGLFGSLDFCECEDCRSVLSPAAYFVDLLQFLNSSPTNPTKPREYTDSSGNKKNVTPLDVLVGNKDAKIAGRRPDLPALPLSCENTNTAMPYIDLVNEIFEYFIAHKGLDAGAAYDTGLANTDDLAAEPQHIIPSVYSDNLRSAVYPLGLPFDLWVETVRAFYSYFRNPLAKALETLRPADNLELFTDANGYAYYRAQILAESLGLSPAEYKVLTITDTATGKPSKQNWFKLYGYPDEATALDELPSAKTLADRLGLTYQELTDLVTAGFLNPGLHALIFEFERFGISLDDALGYTGQPGYAAPGTGFEDSLNAITARYKRQNPSSTFDAKTWLKALLPANYAQKVLVLHDVDTGCNFTSTTLQYADGGKATALDFLKFNLFVRLWKKIGWSKDETDRALQLFFPANLPAWSDANFDGAFSAAWKTALVYLAHLDDLNTRLAPALGRNALLPIWSDLPVKGEAPLYAQIFLTPGVLNSDFAFDDPGGSFPTLAADLPAALKPLSAHLAGTQGVLGLTADEITAILADAGLDPATADFSLANISLCYRYSLLAQCLQFSVKDLIALKAMSGLNPFKTVGPGPLGALADDFLFTQTLQFVKQSAIVQASGFTVEDLKYLLRHQFDPVGKYESDPNAEMALVQTVVNGLRSIQSSNSVPTPGAADDVIGAELSGLVPAQILKALFALLTSSRAFQASQGSVPPASQLDAAPFVEESQITLSYDSVSQVQTLTYRGLLLDWKKSQLLQINNSALFTALLNGVQQQAQVAFQQAIDDLLSVWAGLTDYEAVKTGVMAALDPVPLAAKDPAISLSYDQADKIQWLAYRGVLTEAKKAVLTAVNSSSDLLALLNDVESQSMPAHKSLVGALLGMFTNNQVYWASQASVIPANQIDSAAFFAALAEAQQAGTIPSSIPEIQFSYNTSAQSQTLTCRGVLTDVLRGKLTALIPASSVLANLLQAVRNQALQLFQTLASNILTVAPTDLDVFALPFAGAGDSVQQTQVKAELVTVFAPLLAVKLSRRLVLDTLSENLGSDPSLTEALTTDAGLLTDPSNPGKSLMETFLVAGQLGVSATYFGSADGSGASLGGGIAESADTSDPTNPNAGHAGTGSAHFEGYLRVATDGAYRFFAELGNTGASAQLQINSPNPSALLQNPIIPASTPAAKDNDEISQFVQLKGGVAYHFTLDFGHLGVNGASLLVESGSLPKGPLSQLLLIPQAAVDGFVRAYTLLAKVLQIVAGTGIDERELSFLTAHATEFSNLKLSSLPTRASDDSPARAVALFSQFLTLADYADLRKGPAGGSDGMVDIFENIGATFSEPVGTADSNRDSSTPWTGLANLTRRDAQAVRDVAKYLGLVQEAVVGPNRQVKAVGDFGNNKGLRRIWEILQLAQILGISIASLTGSTVVASLDPPGGSPAPDAIAANLENAVKSRFTSDAWRAIAKSVFDPLRKKKRDALVAYLVQALPAEDENQLFEYFLVDPGMEPVVQTSRLRLALSSVQTFVQRCLLNLENGNGDATLNIQPSSIDADWWAWMKRYRVWEVNRKIFLFPENWMIPELRMDKTDLFQNMESALLQGDVTQDLAEKAFYDYLKGLELRSRLDLVAMYLDQDPAHLDVSTLYVLGRTYGVPHKYFYRTYANGSWSGWEAVSTNIDGDHIVLAVWRGRLNIFWVTWIRQDKKPQTSGGASDTPSASSLGVGNLGHDAASDFEARAQVTVQLHYTEYFQGKWSNPTSTDVKRYDPIDVFDEFDPNLNAFIHVSKETDSGGNEAVRIHLDINAGGGNEVRAFRVTSKNCDPDFGSNYWQSGPSNPYFDGSTGINATLTSGKQKLTASVETDFVNGGGGNYVPEDILGTVNDYEVLRCQNPTAPPFLPQTDPDYLDAGSLVSPFFFKDTSVANGVEQDNRLEQMTFFVQPSLTETTIVEWEEWVEGPHQGGVVWKDPKWMDQVKVVAQVPKLGPPNPGDPVYSIYGIQSRADWATNPATAISYGNIWVGERGRLSAEELSAPVGRAAAAGEGLFLTGSQFAGRAAASGAGRMLVGSEGVRLPQIQAIDAMR